jgi:ABC-type sulfate transport system substrate-binding protein
MTTRRRIFSITAAAILAAASLGAAAQTISLLNVSYDPTRELYVEYNAAFAKYWKAKTGQWIPAGWQKRLPPQLRPLHLHHRLGGAPRQPQRHQGLG